MSRTPARPGYGLFQLLVLLALLGLLVGMLLPAVQKVRVAAARTQSQNNLKQLGLGLHSYHDTYGNFPAGDDDKHFSALARVLPFVDQQALSRKLDLTADSDAKANAAVRATVIKYFLSPLDAAMESDPNPKAGPTNYFLVAGSKPALKDNDGIFYLDSKTRLAAITDGTSNTLLAVESLRGDGGTKALTVARQHVRLKEADLAGLKDDAGVDEFKDGKKLAGDRGSAWVDGRFLQATTAVTRGFNDERPDVDCGGAGGHAGPRSQVNGTNVGLADGSVRFVSGAAKLSVWQAMATRAGGEVGNFD